MKYHQAKKKTIILEILSFFIFLFLAIIGVTMIIIQGDIKGFILYSMGVILMLMLVKFVHWDQDRFYEGKT